MSTTDVRARIARAIADDAGLAEWDGLLAGILEEQAEMGRLAEITRRWLDVQLSRLNNEPATPSMDALNRFDASLPKPRE